VITKKDVKAFFVRGLPACLPHLSVDCVVFGFHGAELKLLLMKWRTLNLWALPGGYVPRRESLDQAAARILCERTGLGRVHLRQFHTFGGLARREKVARRLFAGLRLDVPRDAWTFDRVVSVGYYALVDFWKARPKADFLSDTCAWYPVNGLPPLAYDHEEIVAVALESLRSSLDSPRASAKLLPRRFTMPELQRLHEAILGRKLDRRNFQKRMLDRGGLVRLSERRTGGAHRAPFLYRVESGRAHLEG